METTEEVKNFSVAQTEVPFKRVELTFITSEKKIKSMLGLSHGEKLNQVHKRQKLIIDNVKVIFGLTKKKKFVDDKRARDIDKVINRYRRRNRNFVIEVSKFKVACALDNQPEITNSKYYTDFIENKGDRGISNLIKENAIHMIYFDLMEYVLLQDSEFFSRFTGQSYKQSTTDSFVAFIKPILEHHGYNLQKISQKV